MLAPVRERHAPGWLDFAVLAALYYAAAQLGLLTDMPQGMAIFRPANAVVLAMLLRFEGRRLATVAAVVVATEVLAAAPAAGAAEAALFGLINFGEAAVAFLLLRYVRFDSSFREIADVWRFVLAAPLVAAMLAALCGAAVYGAFGGGAGSYFHTARAWWFGDALGLAVVTPLLLSFAPYGRAAAAGGRAFRAADGWVLVAGALVAAVIALDLAHVVALVPFVLYVGAMYRPRWASLAVAFSVAVIVLMMATGQRPFGDLSDAEAVLVAQRLIFVLTVMGLGFSTLITRMREQQAELEARVLERTAELERANAELGRLAHLDSLSGVGNRRLFDEKLAEVARDARRRGPHSLVLADIDHFKAVNDAHGHGAGDEVIQAFGRILRESARGRDVVARYGGEEFAVLLPQTDLAHALLFAERVRETVAAHAELPHGVRVTASFGVAELGDGGDAAHLVAAADGALYRAKKAGRNRVEPATAGHPAARRVSNS